MAIYGLKLIAVDRVTTLYLSPVDVGSDIHRIVCANLHGVDEKV